MFRTHTTFSMLQATALVATLATILWSTGIPLFRFAEAANVTNFSDTLSDSEPGVVSNHTITFVTPSGLAAGQTISLDFGTGVFSGVSSADAPDIDLNVSGVEQSLVDTSPSGPDWGVVSSGDTIDLTSGTSTIGANATVTIRIGTNAISGGQGSNQITNPVAGTYEITVTMDSGDAGGTKVAIVPTVTVSATVDTIFNFTISGVASGQGVNGDTTTVVTSTTTIPFGTLVADNPATAAQDLQVSTNAANGFVVTVQTDQQLLSSNGADIDGYIDGSYETTPTLWTSPTPVVGVESSYGHWGITTDDSTITPALSDPFDAGGSGQLYVSASTTPVEVFRNDGPTDGTGQGVGLTRVGYSVEISSLQEAANDYTATLTYVATPVF